MLNLVTGWTRDLKVPLVRARTGFGSWGCLEPSGDASQGTVCNAGNKTDPDYVSRDNVGVFGDGGGVGEVHVHTILQHRGSEQSVNLGIWDRVTVLRVPKICWFSRTLKTQHEIIFTARIYYRERMQSKVIKWKRQIECSPEETRHELLGVLSPCSLTGHAHFLKHWLATYVWMLSTREDHERLRAQGFYWELVTYGLGQNSRLPA